jgi:methyl-accepting chemotaxis protein
VIVFALFGAGFLAQRATADSAFDRLEAEQVSEDAARIRIALDYEVRLLKNYGATNSIWDNTYDDVIASDREAFSSDMPPADVREIFGLDGVVGVGPDGVPRVGGLVGASGDYEPLPPDLADPATLGRMYDPNSEPGSGACGVADSAAGPLIYCGFASLRTDSSGPPAGGLIYFTLLTSARLDALGERMSLPLRLADGPHPAAPTGHDVTSDLGELRVGTRLVGDDHIALVVTVPTVTDADIVLEAVQARPIHDAAISTVTKMFLITVGVDTAIGVTMMFLIKRGIKRQVGPLRRTAQAVIASGDRSLRVGDTGRGEIGALGRAVDTMLDALATRDRDLERAHVAREQQARATADKRREAERQERLRTQNLVDHTITAVVGTLEDVVAHTGTVRGATDSIDERVQSTSTITRTVVERAGQADQVVEEMADSLRRVDGIAQLISAVAAQTKLLALNATIEAARAGAAGKGFNVVAGEVKALAATTARSTDEIAATIRTVEQRAAAMAAVIADMSAGIGNIQAATAEVTDVTRQQNLSVDQLNHSVQEAITRIRTMTNLSEQLERRAVPRVPASGTARVRHAGQELQARVADVSEQGLRVCFEDVTTAIRPGDVLDIALTLNGQESMAVRAAVIHHSTDATGDEVGLRLIDPPADVVGRLRDTVAARLERRAT